MPSLKKGRRHNVSDLCNVLCLLFLMHSQWSSIQSILFCLESIFWVFTCILYLLLCRSLCPSSESPSDLGVYYNTLCSLAHSTWPKYIGSFPIFCSIQVFVFFLSPGCCAGFEICHCLKRLNTSCSLQIIISKKRIENNKLEKEMA